MRTRNYTFCALKSPMPYMQTILAYSSVEAHWSSPNDGKDRAAAQLQACSIKLLQPSDSSDPCRLTFQIKNRHFPAYTSPRPTQSPSLPSPYHPGMYLSISATSSYPNILTSPFPPLPYRPFLNSRHIPPNHLHIPTCSVCPNPLSVIPGCMAVLTGKHMSVSSLRALDNSDTLLSSPRFDYLRICSFHRSVLLHFLNLVVSACNQNGNQKLNIMYSCLTHCSPLDEMFFRRQASSG